MATTPAKSAAPAKPTKEALQYCTTLINYETIRLGKVKYDKKMLNDPNRGHWENTNIPFRECTGTFYRDPVLDIKEGYIGINFGSKNVTVAMLDDNSLISPLRIGARDLQKPINRNDFQIPAILHFKNLENFLQDYNSLIGRPLTKWADVAASHTVLAEYWRASSQIFSNFMYDIKPWAGRNSGHLRIKDKVKKTYDLPPFLEITENEFNPVEVYAYYLGSLINNMNNGIHLKYILACTKSFNKEVVDKILESFTNGIKKSLPVSILENEEVMQKFSVELGIDEATAYALTALSGYNFQPNIQESVFYGVFDIGAYTTDFAFGSYKPSEEDKRYTYMLDELGARGNKYLGGEILLEAMAYELLVQNQKTLLKKRVQFTRPKDGKRFIGEDAFISSSEEAKRNTVIMIDALRPLWENMTRINTKMKVMLFDREGFKRKIKFKIKKRELLGILEERIDAGLKDFFEFIKNTCNKFNVYPEKVNIFLAGNSSKSLMVEHLCKKISKDSVIEWNIELLDTYNKKMEQLREEAKIASEEARLERERLELEAKLAAEEAAKLAETEETEEVIESEASVVEINIEPEEKASTKETVSPQKIILNENMYEIFPYIGTNNSLDKMKERRIAITENNYFATMGAMGVAFGVLKGRQGGKILVNDCSLSEDGHIQFQYYVGDCDANNQLQVLITPHTPYGQWIKYIPATSFETEIYYTIYPAFKGKTLNISKAKKAVLRIEEVDIDHKGFIFIRAISPSKVEYMSGSDELGEIVPNGEIREIILDY